MGSTTWQAAPVASHAPVMSMGLGRGQLRRVLRRPSISVRRLFT